MQPQIKEIDYGIAYCVNDNGKRWIEINKNLKKYPYIYQSTLQHEMQHFRSKHKQIDFWLDFKDYFALDFKNGGEWFKFMWENPKSLLASSPLLKDGRKWSVNWFMMIMNFTFLGLLVGGLLLI
jgi:hypothetical protein